VVITPPIIVYAIYSNVLRDNGHVSVSTVELVYVMLGVVLGEGVLV
jgi:hypothetical protein